MHDIEKNLGHLKLAAESLGPELDEVIVVPGFEPCNSNIPTQQHHQNHGEGAANLSPPGREYKDNMPDSNNAFVIQSMNMNWIIPQISYSAPPSEPLIPSQAEEFKGKKLLVLDLDQTLIGNRQADQ